MRFCLFLGVSNDDEWLQGACRALGGAGRGRRLPPTITGNTSSDLPELEKARLDTRPTHRLVSLASPSNRRPRHRPPPKLRDFLLARRISAIYPRTRLVFLFRSHTYYYLHFCLNCSYWRCLVSILASAPFKRLLSANLIGTCVNRSRAALSRPASALRLCQQYPISALTTSLRSSSLLHSLPIVTPY